MKTNTPCWVQSSRDAVVALCVILPPRREPAEIRPDRPNKRGGGVAAPIRLAAAIALAFTALTTSADVASMRSSGETENATAAFPLPILDHFENFSEKDGLPAHKIHCVLKASDGKVWFGTAHGLALLRPDGSFRTYGTADGLSHPTVLAMSEDRATGDLWLATLQGLSKFSGGRFTSFTQTNSGLPNNVVYAVAVAGDTIWAATAAGAGAYDTKAKSWKLYDHNNTVMEEPWCYAIAPAEDRIFLGVWAGGVVEHNPKTGTFKAYRDPDGDFQLQLLPDSGPVADITSWVAYDAHIVWQATYFGLSRYDTNLGIWRTWVQDKTPLASNFINSIFARGRIAWVATDRGVSVTDATYWVNYLIDENGHGTVTTYEPGKEPQRRTMSTPLADGFVMGAWVDGDEAWFATSNGVSHGFFTANPAMPKS